MVRYNYPIFNNREWNNSFTGHNQDVLLDLADSNFKGRPKVNLMAAISREWYNGRHLMAAKPITTPDLHYPMTQFLIV